MEVKNGIIYSLNIQSQVENATQLNFQNLIGKELEWDKVCEGFSVEDEKWLIKLF